MAPQSIERCLKPKKKKKKKKQERQSKQSGENMEALSRRTVDRIYSAVLLGLVVLAWSYVIYASRIAAHWLLERRTAPLQED